MARLQKKTQAAVTTGSAETTGIPRAMGYGLYALSSGTGLFAPVARDARQKHLELGLSSGRPGPHDFAVRLSAVRLTTVTRPPLPALHVS